ncbi:MAG TPA: HIT family hydrolase [Desulfotomaculum sp.]|nr:MAG: Histidine triad (HIT) protein [Desulfotomaculum sp. 46_80]KUK85230.1 MAG: Histidine triad (HIT) protein [Desulfofundulus kuznetsovii]HAG11157.1 HIT family hydrolase [Desulfotomaculum sp.]HBY03266.1 HIT family hydrolase [Desulfotomaculum sp.]
MERIWAPWRTVYVGGKQNEGCIFCEKIQSDHSHDEKNYLLLRSDQVFTLLNLYPYSNGHIMVAPVKHVGDIAGLTENEFLQIGKVTKYMAGLLKEVFKPDGFNIGANLGKVAGAGIPGHIHVHIVPRWNGDTNFMSVVGDVRVISEALDTTYKKLRAAMEVIKFPG